MAQTINTNVMSLNAQRNLNTSQSSLALSMQRLSSGLRVNSAKDDAAGLAIAERMNAQVKGMTVAIRNANDAISLSQTAEGALGKIGDALQRMRELAVQSANATTGTSDRANLDTEFQALDAEVTRLLTGTKFNGTSLLDTAASLTFQVGANNVSTDQIAVATTDLTAGAGITGVNAAARRDGLPRHRDQHDHHGPLHLRGSAEPLRERGQQPADRSREPVRRPWPDRGRGLRGGNREPDSRADPAAGRHRDAGAGQRRAAERTAAAPVIRGSGRPRPVRTGSDVAIAAPDPVIPKDRVTT